MDDLLYVGRNTALTILFVLNVAPKLRSFLSTNTATTEAVNCKLPHVFTALSVSLVVSYLCDPVVLLVQSLRSRGDLPSNTAAVSSVAFLCCIILRLETISTKEIAFSRKAYAIFWLFLLLVEFASSVRVLLRPSLPAPYAQLLFSLPILRAVLCLALFFLLTPFPHNGYKPIRSDPEEADVENDGDGDRDTGIDSDGDCDEGDDITDDVEIRKLVKKEVKELGGWIPYIKSFRIFLKFTWPSDPWLRARFVATFVLLMLQRILNIVQPLQTARLIDAIDTRRDAWTQLAFFLGLHIFNSDLCLGLLTSLAWVDVDLARRSHLKSGVQSKVMLLDYFHLRSRATDTITAIDNAGQVDKLLDTLIFGFFPNIGTLLFAGYGMWERFDTDMMLIILCKAVSYLCAERKYMEAYLARYSTYVKSRDSQERRRQDGIRGWITVSAHNMVARENKRYAEEVDDLMEKTRGYRMTNILYLCLDEVIFHVAIGLGWGLVVFKVLSFESTIGSLTAFLGLWSALMESINYFKSFFTDLMEALTDMVRLKKLMEEKPRIQDGDTSLALTKGEICLENISSAYPGSDREIITNLSLTIEGGTKVALVGPSGSGKSTLLKLASRQLLPTKGRILIDGNDITTLSKDSLHYAVGMMVQDPHIFDRSVLYNVRYSKPDAKMAEVYEACKSAGIHDTIMGRPDRYETRTGPNGANFSGGERQRMLLARTFLQKPRVVLIDEGTSALDSETESDIKRSIAKEFPESTVIIVAHRLSSIRNADRIIVFGKRCETLEGGARGGLLARKGTYAKYWKRHLGLDDDEDISTSLGSLIDISE